jgi:hypothetical protein
VSRNEVDRYIERDDPIAADEPVPNAAAPMDREALARVFFDEMCQQQGADVGWDSAEVSDDVRSAWIAAADLAMRRLSAADGRAGMVAISKATAQQAQQAFLMAQTVLDALNPSADRTANGVRWRIDAAQTELNAAIAAGQ